MKVLLTGATGFIGLHLATALQQKGYQLVCAVRPTAERAALTALGAEIVDIENLLHGERAALAGCEVLLHLAGQMGAYGTSYAAYYQTNCVLTERLAELAVLTGVKQFLFCSTPGVYGFGQRFCREDALYAPRSDYEKTKVLAEKSVIRICDGTDTAYTILRPDFVYGPGDRRRVKLYRNILHHKFILTTSGKSYLHPTYIDDVIQGFMLCIGKEEAKNQIFNIAGEKDVPSGTYLREIANQMDVKLFHINIGYSLSIIIAEALDKSIQMLLHKEGFVSKNKIDFLAIDHSSSIKKAQSLLGYVPVYSLRQGLKKTLDWCKEEGLL